MRYSSRSGAISPSRYRLLDRLTAAMYSHSPTHSSKIIAPAAIIISAMPLCALPERMPEKSARTPFRLPIDRVFSVDGFGTIVTGTLIDGHIAVCDDAQLLPLGNQCRVRNLQVHGRDVSAAPAGPRAAVFFARI